MEIQSVVAMALRHLPRLGCNTVQDCPQSLQGLSVSHSDSRQEIKREEKLALGGVPMAVHLPHSVDRVNRISGLNRIALVIKMLHVLSPFLEVLHVLAVDVVTQYVL